MANNEPAPKKKPIGRIAVVIILLLGVVGFYFYWNKNDVRVSAKVIGASGGMDVVYTIYNDSPFNTVNVSIPNSSVNGNASAAPGKFDDLAKGESTTLIVHYPMTGLKSGDNVDLKGTWECAKKDASPQTHSFQVSAKAERNDVWLTEPSVHAVASD